MSRKRKILVADLLCGAGGSSTGCMHAMDDLGIDLANVELACVNHWPVAIDTHRRNHPEARHYVQDIASVRPHIVVPEGYLDLLMASPTCTHHSVARGGKPTSDQQRSDPWHIITWLTELRVKRIIIENVWEFRSWGPVDRRTGKPVQSRKGEYFHAWIETIRRLGFEPEWRKLNAADYGDATTRQRFILMARSDGRRVSWPMPTHRKRSEVENDLFPGLKPWKPARDIIDWSIRGKSIFNRKKALAPKTLARIYAGAVKFDWPEPYLVVLRNHMAAQGLDVPLPTIAANGTHIGLAEPVVVSTAHGVDASEQDPHRRRTKSADEPLGTIHAGGGNFGLAEPVVVNMKGKSTASPVDQPLPTQTSHAAHLFTAEPVIMNGRKGNRAKGVGSNPLPTLDTKGGVWLAEPFVMSRQSCGAPRAIDEPVPTQVAKHSHALISPYYGSGSGETCETAEEPLPTVTAKGRFGMVVPVTHSQSGNRARDVRNEPLPTMTTAKGGEFAFVAAAFGERTGQAPRVHDIEEPAPTICATGRVPLVEAAPRFDILFRMLEPHELAAAMGFTTDEAEYEFAGTKTDQIKQIGNAVSVSKMRACVGAIMADAAPKQRQADGEDVEFQEAAE